MARPRHPDKSIEQAVRHAESLGWTVEMSNGHCRGHILRPLRTREGCIVGIFSTPRNPEGHARNIRRAVDVICRHGRDAIAPVETK